MAGYFYAYASKATCRAANPAWFQEGEDGEFYLIGGRIEYSTRGVALVAAVLSEPDEEGNQTVITPAELSVDYVVLTPHENDASLSKLIAPVGVQGFA